jgi:hypothetical protein
MIGLDWAGDVCVCGHPRSEHYSYLVSTNGGPLREQGRCRACDPLAGNHEPNVALEAGSYAAAMYAAADHDFQLASCEAGEA